MAIPTMEYRGHVLRAYSKKVFPTHHDPYAGGPKQFSSVVMVDNISPAISNARRYAIVFRADPPARGIDAIDLAMEYGKDIVDGKIDALPLVPYDGSETGPVH